MGTDHKLTRLAYLASLILTACSVEQAHTLRISLHETTQNVPTEKQTVLLQKCKPDRENQR